MIYETAKVGGPVARPLVLSLNVGDSIPPSHDTITDSEGAHGFVSDLREYVTEVRGSGSMSDSYTLHTNITDAQPPGHPTLTDVTYNYGALSLSVWDAVGFNDITSAHELFPLQLVKTGHIKLSGEGKFLLVTDTIPDPSIVTLSDPTPLPVQPVKLTGSTGWFGAELNVTGKRTKLPHLVVSDADIVTQDLNTTYTTADLLNSGEKLQYWS